MSGKMITMVAKIADLHVMTILMPNVSKNHAPMSRLPDVAHG